MKETTGLAGWNNSEKEPEFFQEVEPDFFTTETHVQHVIFRILAAHNHCTYISSV